MNLQTLFNSRLGVGFALGLGRLVPPGTGYKLAELIARLIARRRSARIVQVVRANQWVVSQGQLSARELDERTSAAFQQTGRCLYDLYHYETQPQAMARLVKPTPEFNQVIARNLEDKQAALLVCPHLSNFDLVGRVIAMSGVSVQILSYPQPASGYRWQNEMRKKYGLEMTPMSIASLRQATKHLENGGIAITGIDRPLADGGNYQPKFFGRLATLPAFHIRLALKTRLPIVVVAARALPDGTYTILASDPIEMQPHPDLKTEIVQNQEAVLAVCEPWIRQTPDQWSMFYPVWPEALAEMPR